MKYSLLLHLMWLLFYTPISILSKYCKIMWFQTNLWMDYRNTRGNTSDQARCWPHHPFIWYITIWTFNTILLFRSLIDKKYTLFNLISDEKIFFYFLRNHQQHQIPLVPSLAHRAEVIVFHSFWFVSKSFRSCVFYNFSQFSSDIIFFYFQGHNILLFPGT
jgi:hypothetical protein